MTNLDASCTHAGRTMVAHVVKQCVATEGVTPQWQTNLWGGLQQALAIATEDADKWSNGDYAETSVTVHMLIFGTADTVLKALSTIMIPPLPTEWSREGSLAPPSMSF